MRQIWERRCEQEKGREGSILNSHFGREKRLKEGGKGGIVLFHFPLLHLLELSEERGPERRASQGEGGGGGGGGGGGEQGRRQGEKERENEVFRLKLLSFIARDAHSALESKEERERKESGSVWVSREGKE